LIIHSGTSSIVIHSWGQYCAHTPQWWHISGSLVASQKSIAPTEQVFKHRLQPMQASFSSFTPPPFLGERALAGQLSMQAGSVQPWQTVSVNLPEIPPYVRIFIRLCSNEWLLELTPAQTSIQEKHPMHLFILPVRKTFGIKPLLKTRASKIA